MKTIKIILAVWLTGAGLFAIPTKLNIKDVSYSKSSKKLKVVYSNTFNQSETTLTDSGPLLLCVINRLLKDKYNFYLDLPKDKKISKTDLAIITQASRLLDREETMKIAKSVKAYLQSPSQDNGTAIFEILVSSIRSGLKDHDTQWERVSEKASTVTQEARQRLSRIENILSAISEGTPDSELGDEEKALTSKLKRQLVALETVITETKPEKKRENGNSSPVKFDVCTADEESKSRTVIDNENVDELLAKVQTILTELLPQTPGPQRTHE